jgi:hypothetical protein
MDIEVIHQANVIREEVAKRLMVKQATIKGHDWLAYYDQELADHAASITQKCTGDYCSVVQRGKRYGIVRLDPSGKSVQPRSGN